MVQDKEKPPGKKEIRHPGTFIKSTKTQTTVTQNSMQS
jgi:hypothetical protein